MSRKPNKFPGRIRNRLIVIFLIPTLMLVSVSGGYYFHLAGRALEEEMGLRLRSLAGSAVHAISGEAVTRFEPEDEVGRSYRNAREELRKLMALGNAERIYVFTPKGKSLLDTKEDISIGAEYFRLDADRFELEQVFTNGVTVSSTMFTGEDGKLYKTGYAPLRVGDEIVAAIAVDAGVRFFTVLASMRQNMFIFGLIGILAIISISLFIARGIERPVARLVEAARRIGTGDFDHEIIPKRRDEIGFLANTLNEMRKNIVERDRYLQMLQRGIAHEVRNPLGGMGLFCDILTEELGEDESKIEHVQKIRREVEGLNKVVNDFLDFTRDVSLDKREVDLGSFLSDIMMHYAATTEGTGVEIVQEIKSDVERVVLDPELVRRAMFNLINNALQAMPNGGTMTVAVILNHEMLELQVRDTGPGISPEDIECIFTPFFTTKDKGTGLGLPFAKKIAENHGGKIEIDSTLGEGTTITLIVPVILTDELRS